MWNELSILLKFMIIRKPEWASKFYLFVYLFTIEILIMPFYYKLGKITHKRHTVFEKEEGGTTF